MGIVSYTLFAYVLTAVISLAVMALVVIVGKAMGKPEDDGKGE